MEFTIIAGAHSLKYPSVRTTALTNVNCELIETIISTGMYDANSGRPLHSGARISSSYSGHPLSPNSIARN
jgi:hypothetical protein